MRKASVVFTLVTASGLWLGCSKDNSAPTLEGTWQVNIGTFAGGTVTPSSFAMTVWASADSYIVSMPILTWSVGPTTYNGRAGVIKFSGTDTLAGFFEPAYQNLGSGSAIALLCHSIEFFGAVRGAHDTLFHARVAVIDTVQSIGGGGIACASRDSGDIASVTAHKVGAAGNLPAVTRLTAPGTWHVTTGTLLAGTLSPDTFTMVIGSGTAAVSASLPALTFNNGVAAAYDTFASAYLYGGDTVAVFRAHHGVTDDATCRYAWLYGFMNTRPDTMTGTVLVQDSTASGCALVSAGPFTATKGP